MSQNEIPISPTTEKRLLGVFFNAEYPQGFMRNGCLPTIIRYYCCLDGECPVLRHSKECIHNRILTRGCVFGSVSHETGPSKRAKSYGEFCRKGRKEATDLPSPEVFTGQHLYQIGDFIHLPFSHMSLCRSAPFLEHSDVMSSGLPFIRKADFTPQVVVALATFRPCALMGGEITSYQKEVVPRFLLSLKLEMPTLYQQAAKLYPPIEERTLAFETIRLMKTTLASVPVGTIGFLVGRDKAMCVDWDGTWLELSGTDKQFGFFLSGYAGTDMTLRFRPILDKTDVYITDPQMIGEVLRKKPSAIKDWSPEKSK